MRSVEYQLLTLLAIVSQTGTNTVCECQTQQGERFCYTLDPKPEPKLWTEARGICEGTGTSLGTGADLPTLSSQVLHEIFVQVVKKHTTSKPNWNVCVGARYHKQWVWLDGKEIENRWARGQPKKGSLFASAVISTSSNGAAEWTGMDQDDTCYPIICQHKTCTIANKSEVDENPRKDVPEQDYTVVYIVAGVVGAVVLITLLATIVVVLSVRVKRQRDLTRTLSEENQKLSEALQQPAPQPLFYGRPVAMQPVYAPPNQDNDSTLRGIPSINQRIIYE